MDVHEKMSRRQELGRDCVVLILMVHNVTSYQSLILGAILQEFDEQDVKRVRDEDFWLSCFLKSRKQDVDIALSVLVSYVHLSHFFSFQWTSLREEIILRFSY